MNTGLDIFHRLLPSKPPMEIEGGFPTSLSPSRPRRQEAPHTASAVRGEKTELEGQVPLSVYTHQWSSLGVYRWLRRGGTGPPAFRRQGVIEKNQELVESMVSFMKDVGINAKANFVETSIRTAMDLCGIGKEGAGGTQVGWQSATEATPPTCEGGVGVGQVLEGIGFGYETMDYAKFINRHMLCESARSTVCVPEKEEEWSRARTLAGEERRQALEEIANWQREHVYIIPMFDLFAVYGVNPKLRGFEEPRFDKHTFAGLWWFEE
jgi:hypothetical protein